MMDIDAALAAHLRTLDMESLRRRFVEQDEALVVEDFLPQAVADALLAALPRLRPNVNRNYLPGHKKGGSVSRFDLDRLAPEFPAIYRSKALTEFFKALTGAELLPCPPEDPHTYALYYYTEPGDHIGWHYDTSYYKGARYTVLFGLVDRSSCRLEFELYRGRTDRQSEHHSIALKPGTFVIFNGDKLWHRVTPAGDNEERIVLTLEYLTSAQMSGFGRFISNMKDAVAYFGFRQVFSRKRATG
jgi:alkylated DNA repair dioxygenase AlkB